MATTKTPTEHLFWARELITLARKQAAQKGVPDHVLAQAMMVQSWMIFTGQSEMQARRAVSKLFSESMRKAAKKASAAKASASAPP
jgi:hypothetical protein